jgi:hypothetical protein
MPVSATITTFGANDHATIDHGIDLQTKPGMHLKPRQAGLAA